MEGDLSKLRMGGYIPLKTEEGSAGTANERTMLKIWHDAEVAHGLHSEDDDRTKMTSTRAAEPFDAAKVEDVRDDGENDLKIP